MIVYIISNIVVNRLCNSPVAASPFRIALTSPSKHCLSAGRCEESNLRSSPIQLTAGKCHAIYPILLFWYMRLRAERNAFSGVGNLQFSGHLFCKLDQICTLHISYVCCICRYTNEMCLTVYLYIYYTYVYILYKCIHIYMCVCMCICIYDMYICIIYVYDMYAM